MPLDKIQILKYVQGRGARCPYCKSYDIEGTGEDSLDGSEYLQGVDCNNCGKHWIDVYKLNDIVEDEDENSQNA